MIFLSITSSDKMWNEVSQFAQNCSWRAGKSLSKSMSDNTFTDWERVIVAIHENGIAGYCTVAKNDCIPNIPYTPYIGYLFVDEKYRGHRLSQKLIFHAMAYLRTLKFSHVFLVSDHVAFCGAQRPPMRFRLVTLRDKTATRAQHYSTVLLT